MKFRQSQYEFSLNDSGFIQALSENLTEVSIESITPDFKISVNNSACKNLPTLIEKIRLAAKQIHQTDNIKIRLLTKSVPVYLSMLNVMPNFVKKTTEYLTEQDKQTLDVAAKLMGNYIQTRAFLAGGTLSAKIPLPLLTREQAWKALTFADQKSLTGLPIITAFDLPSLNAIYIMTTEFQPLIINYAEQYIKETDHFFLDLDEGFINLAVALPPSKKSFVPVELTNAFELWKKNGCRGKIIIPTGDPGLSFVLSEQPTKSLTVATTLALPQSSSPTQLNPRSLLWLPIGAIAIALILSCWILSVSFLTTLLFTIVAAIATYSVNNILERWIAKEQEKRVFEPELWMKENAQAYDLGYQAKSWLLYWQGYSDKRTYIKYPAYRIGLDDAMNKEFKLPRPH